MKSVLILLAIMLVQTATADARSLALTLDEQAGNIVAQMNLEDKISLVLTSELESVTYPKINSSEKMIAGFVNLDSNCVKITSKIDMQNLPESVILAIESGADVIFNCREYKKQKILESLLDAVENGRLSESQFRESAFKIVKLKLQLKSNRN